MGRRPAPMFASDSSAKWVPTLAALATAPYPSVTHHLLETLEQFTSDDPALIFRLVTDALSSGGRRGGYQFESLGAELFVAHRPTIPRRFSGRSRGRRGTTSPVDLSARRIRGCRLAAGAASRIRPAGDAPVNRGEIETFKRKARDLRDRYQLVLADLERDAAIRANVDPATFVGEGNNLALEAHVRLYVLDPLLRELGWEVQTPANMVVEDGVQPLPGDVDAHRRRLDYHGRDAAERRSLLAVEAKRPSVRLPDTAGRPVDQWIAHALRLINTSDPRAARLPAGWKEILDTAIDYVRRVQNAYGDVPMRFVLTNGDWFVVFSQLDTTLLAPEPVVERIRVFGDLADVIANVDQFCQLLGYQDLSGQIPPQDPGALPEFVPAGEEAVCARFVEISYIRHGERQPVISVRAGAWIAYAKRRMGPVPEDVPRQFLLLSDDSEELVVRRQQVVERADSLLADLRNHRQVRFATLNESESSDSRRRTRCRCASPRLGAGPRSGRAGR